MFLKKGEVAIKYPTDLQIETTNRCNARCVFCHHPNMKRPLTDMSDDLFQKIVQDAKALKVQAIHPFISGEPFLDRKAFDKMALVNAELPAVKLKVFTNAFLLDEEKAAKLSMVRNVELLNISLNACEAADYKSRVGLNFDRTVANIKNLLRLNRERKFVDNIVIASVEHGKEDKVRNKAYNDAFIRFCEENFPGAQYKVGYKYNYLSRVRSFRGFRDVHCPRLRTMTVLANGLVSLCCMDMEGEYILGNANERSLLDIYNSPLAREYRRNRKSRMVPCRFCNMI